MSFRKIISDSEAHLSKVIHGAIVQSVLATHKRCGSRPPQEPDYVASLVCDAVPLIYKNLCKLLKRHRARCSVIGVYCHQTPKVEYNSRVRPCEIGDLLFVHVHTNHGGFTERYALLLQAKMSARREYPIPKKERHQLGLYKYWPRFWYLSPQSLTGEERHVTPSTHHMGAQYLLINGSSCFKKLGKHFAIPWAYFMGTCVPDEELFIHNELSDELLDVIGARSGRAFYSHMDTKGDDWSKIVWDLLRVGLTTAFNRRNSRRIQEARVSGDVEKLHGYFYAESMDLKRTTSTVRELLGDDDTLALYSATDWPLDAGTTEEKALADLGDKEGVSIILIESSDTLATEG